MEQYSVEAILSVVDKGFSSGMDKALQSVKKLESGSADLAKSITGGIVKGAAVGGAAIVALGGASIKAAGDMQAVNAQFDEVFKGMTTQGTEALQRLSKETSIMPDRMKSSFTQIASFAKVNGMDMAQSLGFAERATRAAADSAAFYDKSLETVNEELKSYLKGNFNVADNLGILSTETTRNTAAMEQFGKEFKDLDGIQRQEVLMKMYEDANKLSGALGQASREADGLENVLGNFKQGIKGMMVELGKPMLPGFIEGAKKLGEVFAAITPKISLFMDAFSRSNIGQGLIQGFNNLIKSADSFIAKINSIKSFDPNMFDQFGKSLLAVGLAFPLLEKSIPILGAMGEGMNVLQSKAGGWTKQIGKDFINLGNNIKGAGMKWAGTANNFITKIPLVGKQFKNLTSQIPALGNQFTSLGTKLTGFINKVPGVSKLGNIFKSLTGTLQQVGGVGVKSLSMMSSGMMKMMSLGMSLLGPIALLGAGLAALGLAGGMFGEQINQMLNVATTQGPQIITNFANGIISKLPELINRGAEIVVGFGNALAANIPTILQKGVDIITTLVQGVMANMPQLIGVAFNVIGSFVRGLATVLPQLLTTGMQLLQSLAEGIVQNLPLLIQQGQTAITNFVTSLQQNLPKIIQAGIQTIMSLIQGISQNMPQIINMGISLITGLFNTIVQNLPMLLQGGVQIVTALIQGIIQNIPAIVQGAGQLISSFIQGIGTVLPNILSAGVQIIVAVVKGIITGIPQIGKAALEIGKAVVDGVKQGLLNLKNVVGDKLQEAGGWIKGKWDSIWGKTPEPVQKAANEITPAVNTINNNINTLPTNANTAVNNMNSAFTMSDIDNWALQTTTATSNVNNAFATVNPQPIVDSFGNVISASNNLATQVPNNALTAANGFVNNSQTVTQATGPYTETGNKIAEVMANMAIQNPLVAGAAAAGVVRNSNVAGAESSYATFVANAKGQLNNLENSAGKSAANASDNVISNTSTMQNKATSNFSSMNIQSAIQMVAMAAAALAQGALMKKNITTNVEGMKSATLASVTAMRTSFAQGMAQIASSAQSGGQQIQSSMKSAMTAVVSIVSSSMSSAVSAMRSASGSASSAGYQMGMGFYSGLSSTAGSIYSLASSIASNAAAMMRSALRIHSPSRVTRDIGINTGLGQVVGMERTVPLVEKTAKQLALAAIPNINETDFSTVMGKIPENGSSFNHRMTIENNDKEPANIYLRMGQNTFSTFTDDIYNENNRKLELKAEFA